MVLFLKDKRNGFSLSPEPDLLKNNWLDIKVFAEDPRTVVARKDGLRNLPDWTY